MSIKVIGAGFGRTGTTSLKFALEKLGFDKCYHMVEVIRRPIHGQAWHAAWRGQPVDWDSLLAGYQATVDWPGATFYRQLMAHYPEAKVVLSVRDPEKWYASTAETIYELRSFIPMWLGKIFPPVRHMPEMVEAVVWQGTFDGRFADQAHALSVFQNHIDEVKKSVPPDRLLVFNVKEGWEPLCRFLEVPVPAEPFPHLNDRQMLKQLIVIQKWLPLILVLALAAAAGLAAFITRRILRRWLDR